MTHNTYIQCSKVDYRGAAAPKKSTRAKSNIILIIRGKVKGAYSKMGRPLPHSKISCALHSREMKFIA